MATNRLTGQIGEQRAQDFLISKNFTIRATNVSSRWGELDIIAQKDNKIHFVEVKSRISMRQGKGYEAVRIPKLSHSKRAIQFYIQVNNLQKHKFQLDVISIQLDREHNVLDLKYYEDLLIQGIY